MKLYEDKYSVKVGITESKIDREKLTRDEITCLYAFVISLLKLGLPSDYCFGNYGEERVCIYKNDNSWEVYFTANGNRNGIAIYDNCQDACIHAINLISKGTSVKKIAVDTFARILNIDFTNKELSDFVKFFCFDRENLSIEDKRACREYKRSLSTLYKRY